MEGEARPRIPHTPDLPATPSSVFWATAFPLRGVGYQGHLPGPMSEGFRPTLISHTSIFLIKRHIYLTAIHEFYIVEKDAFVTGREKKERLKSKENVGDDPTEASGKVRR